MEWSKPSYSRDQVNLAGKVLKLGPSSGPINGERYQEALAVMNNWRASHSYPLSIVQNRLRSKTLQIDKSGFVAQRLKRRESILAKLKSTNLRLAQIQDIGGCRAVFTSWLGVMELVTQYKKGRTNYRVTGIDDYIMNPKESGYRSLHLKGEYYSDSKPEFNGLRLEIQVRTKLQHAWATAVEVVQTCTGEPLKAGHGNPDWLRFFVLMGAFQAHKEGGPPIPGTPGSLSGVISEIKELEKRMNVLGSLRIYSISLLSTQLDSQQLKRNAYYFLIQINPRDGTSLVAGFPKKDVLLANAEYARIEQLSQPPVNTVLVAADSIQSLRTAYPNYFLDTVGFAESVREAIS